jgi:hypothetical protein
LLLVEEAQLRVGAHQQLVVVLVEEEEETPPQEILAKEFLVKEIEVEQLVMKLALL